MAKPANKREHFGACKVLSANLPGASYPTMEGAIEALDPFNAAIYWPLHNVVPYLGRMGVR